MIADNTLNVNSVDTNIFLKDTVMTKSENLLVFAAEECSEIAKAISKALRFGMRGNNRQLIQFDLGINTNEYDILEEYFQLQAVFEMLFEEGVLRKLTGEQIKTIISEEKSKVRKYAKLSSCIGTIEGIDGDIADEGV